MRKNLGAQPLMYPQPVLILATYAEDGTPNAMNAAWGGITMNDQISFRINPNHATIKNIKAAGAFTVSMATGDFMVECDYVGLVSQKNVPNKLEIAGFHTTKSEFVNAPIIDELPLTLECELKLYDDEEGRLVGRIVNVSADESILNGDLVDPKKLNPLIFDTSNRAYWSIGERLGTAFNVGNEIKNR